MTKDLYKDLVVGVLLACLVVARILSSEDTQNYIASVNYFGMLLALYDLLLGVRPLLKRKRNKDVYIACVFLSGVVCLIIGSLVFFSIITFPAIVNDIVTLGALLCSLCKGGLTIVISGLINGIRV